MACPQCYQWLAFYSQKQKTWSYLGDSSKFLEKLVKETSKLPFMWIRDKIYLFVVLLVKSDKKGLRIYLNLSIPPLLTTPFYLQSGKPRSCQKMLLRHFISYKYGFLVKRSVSQLVHIEHFLWATNIIGIILYHLVKIM